MRYQTKAAQESKVQALSTSQAPHAHSSQEQLISKFEEWEGKKAEMVGIPGREG